jgi:hypothetical protein
MYKYYASLVGRGKTKKSVVKIFTLTYMNMYQSSDQDFVSYFVICPRRFVGWLYTVSPETNLACFTFDSFWQVIMYENKWQSQKTEANSIGHCQFFQQYDLEPLPLSRGR